MLNRLAAALLVVCGLAVPAAAQTSDCGKSAIEHELEIHPTNEEPTPHLSLADAMDILNVPSVSIAVIDQNKLSLVCAFGGDTTTATLYQAASMSKTVAAVMALRLVEQGRLDLDADVSTELHSWHLPASELTNGHPVTLRGLLSMTGGIGVHGFEGYEPGEPLPNLNQILDGSPPAHPLPVRVETVPGSEFFYSGGGYEIVEALIHDATGRSFADVADQIVFQPMALRDSLFTQPLPKDRLSQAAIGRHRDGDPLPGGSRIQPELAAAGLWSMPSDLSASYRGEPGHLLKPATAQAMFSRQNGGLYGLGGAVAGSGHSLVLGKAGENLGFQGYLLIFPETGQGIVIMTNSERGTILAKAMIWRAAAVYRWPPLSELPD